MTRKGFYFDSTRCVGCKTCQVACKLKNHLPAGVTYRAVANYQVGEYPKAKYYHISHSCNHCENPACVRSCPTGAMHKNEADGTVQHNDEVCIGCRSCAMACPYGVPVYLEEEGIVGKCNGCIDTREADGAPTCVAACGTRALEFGDFDELQAKHPGAVTKTACLPSDQITHPSSLVLGGDALMDEGYEDLVL